MKRQIRDGHNQTYPLWILNHYFAAYYSFAFGQPAQFDLQLVDDKGKSFSKQVAALTKDSIRLLRQQRYSHSISPGTVKGITLEENPVDSFAILTIKSFDADWLKSVHQQDFSSVTDSIFRQLKLHRTRNLLLDLRDNQGGDFETGRYLLSYLIKAPSEYLMGGKESRRLQPAKNNFTGGLFVLVNGGSFSNTAIVSTCLERDQRATFIGEETGGNKFLIYGEPTDITLPYTKIQVYISTTPFRISWQRSDHGIMPGHIVRPGPEDFLTRKDPARILALKLMTNRKSE